MRTRSTRGDRAARAFSRTLLCAAWFLCAVASLKGLGAEGPGAEIEDLARKIRAGGTSLRAALSSYDGIERAKRYDVFARHRIHERLLAELKKLDDPDVASAVRSALRGTSRAAPSEVLLLKAVVGERFPASRAERIAILLEAAKHKDRSRAVWGVRLLGDSRWKEAVDALIDLLGELEVKQPEGLLTSMVSSELYRLLGAEGRGTSAAIRRNWERLGKKIPEKPDYSLASGGEVTFVFFGDRISPYSVFAIDFSTSMREETSLKYPGARGTTTAGKDPRPADRLPKVEIVKRELLRALESLPASSSFNILGYNATFTPWKASAGRIALERASPSAVRSAKAFVERMPVAQGTNIHDTLVAAFEVQDVETIYLLSDGVPSRGGGPAEIERRAAALNYLRGVRIVTYGFGPEGTGSYDEEFMKRLARENWGWYRRLN